MNKHYLILLIILAFLIPVCHAAGAEKSLEMVSLSADTHINEAVQILETYTLKSVNKKMINLSGYNGTINIPINNLPWDRALELILLQNKLIQKDHPGFISIEDIPVIKTDAIIPPNPEAVFAQTKLVRIKAIAMLVDRAYLKTLGIDWSTVFNGKVLVNAGFFGAAQAPTSTMNLGLDYSTSIDGYPVDLNTVIKTLESNQKGNIIAKPNILVTSGKKGYIQVGQDISVKTVDEAGNTTDTFFATGVIMDVQPTITNVNGADLINMKLSIERSSGAPGAVSTIITKSKSQTELTLYNGEETVIGGLFDTDETKTRAGIPILKDLPWWFFGIRYLTGYDRYEKKERELVITLKAEVVESAYDRSLLKADQEP